MRTLERLIRLDGEKCTNCQICELSCSAFREHGFSPRKARLHVERGDALEASLRICNLCEPPACVVACPTHAVEVSDSLRLVSFAAEDCSACGRCVHACPQQALTLWREAKSPAVCDFCADHPKCVENCPWGALVLEFHLGLE